MFNAFVDGVTFGVLQRHFGLTLSLPMATIVIVDTVPVPLATKVDRTPSVPLVTVIALFTNVRDWSLISLT